MAEICEYESQVEDAVFRRNNLIIIFFTDWQNIWAELKSNNLLFVVNINESNANNNWSLEEAENVTGRLAQVRRYNLKQSDVGDPKWVSLCYKRILVHFNVIDH